MFCKRKIIKAVAVTLTLLSNLISATSTFSMAANIGVSWIAEGKNYFSHAIQGMLFL